MVIIEQCEIDPKGTYLIIEAVVENLDYYENVYIKDIIIDTDKTYKDTGFNEEKCIYRNSKSIKPIEEKSKRVKLCLTAKELNLDSLNDNIFFVYIETEGTPYPEPPCCKDHRISMGVAVNLRPIYNMAMGYIKELSSTCTVPRGFIDMILRLKALDLSLKTGNYYMAFNQWDKLFKNKINVPLNKGCGCNGLN